MQLDYKQYHGKKASIFPRNNRGGTTALKFIQDMQKTGVYRKLVSDWIPMAVGTCLTGLLFWSFFLSPYIDAVQAHSTSTTDKSSNDVNEGGRHTLSLKENSKVKSEGVVPDIQLLLNKTHSIDPLLNTSFALGRHVSNWDEQRKIWLEENPNANMDSSGNKPKLLLVTGSQPHACHNFMGDHMLLRSIKNKIDYCRQHEIEIFYNLATFTSDMPSWWVKLPLIRTLMLAHPEVEWFWWMDSDAVFTDMTFEFPVEKYAGYNLVIHGWETLVYDVRQWTGLNMGIFLVRNCQWTLDLFDTLAPMGLKGEVGDKIGKILTQSLTGRPENFESDDQGAFVYLMNAERERWGSKIYLEHAYFLNGYWKDLVDNYEEYEKTSHPGFGDERWPFVTHFTGCQICSGKINNVYSPEDCRKSMDRALNFADNQVLQSYGYGHPGLSTSEIVRIEQLPEQGH